MLDQQRIMRMMRLKGPLEQSAYTMAMARNQDHETIKPILARLEKLEKSLAEQNVIVKKLTAEKTAEQEALHDALKPFADKELEGIEMPA